MTDIVSKEKRSDIMSKVHSKNNKSTEQKLIKIFKKYKITGWRRNYKVIGHPDFVFLNKKLAIFVDGCFWHGHGCRKLPDSNREFWLNKQEYNKIHDEKISKYFISRGWIVMRIWECELRKRNEESIAQKIIEILTLQ